MRPIPETGFLGLLAHAFGPLVLARQAASLRRLVDPDHPLAPTWAFVAARAIPVVVHVGHAVSGLNPAEVSRIANVATLAPDAIVIVAHCGHPAGELVLDLLERFPNLHADLAPVVAEPVALPPARVAGLAHKLLFGSDAPNAAIPAEASLDRVRGLRLAAAAERQILGGTARRLERGVKVG